MHTKHTILCRHVCEGNSAKEILMIETILKDEFIDYRFVKEQLVQAGLNKEQIKMEKLKFGVKTIQIANEEGERGWLWYIPKNVWNRHFAEK
jgi:hypothetical protein